jgi:putative hydrolase of the HAD superfamily
MDGLDVIFFDVAGTLIGVRGSVGEIYARIASRHGLSSDPAELEANFVSAFREQSSDPCLAPEDSDPVDAERRWWRELVARVFEGRMAPEAFEGFFHEVFEVFRTAEGWELFPDTVPTIERLRGRGYRLGIISNFDSRLDDLLPALGLTSCFEQVVLSWRVGFAKPDRRIFTLACERMAVIPARALHVGDSVSEDAEGALAAGLRAVLLDRKDLHSGWRRGRRIRTLAKLV